MAGFFKAQRSDDAMELIRANRNAFILLYVIASRARRTNGYNGYNLKIGEALIGDFDSCGMTEREYRTAKTILENAGFATFNPTSKGTIATLMDSRVFDINAEASDEQIDDHTTSGRRSHDDHATTNKKEKKEKKEKKGLGQTPTGRSQTRNLISKPCSVEEVFEYGLRIGCDEDVILRFIRYNNLQNWSIESWHAALAAFQKHVEEQSGMLSEVPESWIPTIE